MYRHIKKHDLDKYLLVIVGAFVFSFGVNLFTVPMGLFNGGVVGLSQIFRTIIIDKLHVPLPKNIDVSGIIYFLINIPLLFLAYKQISKHFFHKTVLYVVAQTFFLTLIPIPKEAIISDVTAACLTGAIVCGFGCGLALRAGGSAGGTDILGIFFTKKYRDFSVGKLGTWFNALVYIACAVLFNVEIAIYSIIYSVFMNFVVDKFHVQNVMTTALIITKSDKLEASILSELTRGVTYWNGTGAYTKEGVYVLLTAISKYEVNKLKLIVKEHDKHAFIIFVNRVSVSGNFEKRLT